MGGTVTADRHPQSPEASCRHSTLLRRTEAVGGERCAVPGQEEEPGPSGQEARDGEKGDQARRQARIQTGAWDRGAPARWLRVASVWEVRTWASRDRRCFCAFTMQPASAQHFPQGPAPCTAQEPSEGVPGAGPWCSPCSLAFTPVQLRVTAPGPSHQYSALGLRPHPFR